MHACLPVRCLLPMLLLRSHSCIFFPAHPSSHISCIQSSTTRQSKLLARCNCKQSTVWSLLLLFVDIFDQIIVNAHDNQSTHRSTNVDYYNEAAASNNVKMDFIVMSFFVVVARVPSIFTFWLGDRYEANQYSNTNDADNSYNSPTSYENFPPYSPDSGNNPEDVKDFHYSSSHGSHHTEYHHTHSESSSGIVWQYLDCFFFLFFVCLLITFIKFILLIIGFWAFILLVF